MNHELSLDCSPRELLVRIGDLKRVYEYDQAISALYLAVGKYPDFKDSVGDPVFVKLLLQLLLHLNRWNEAYSLIANSCINDDFYFHKVLLARSFFVIGDLNSAKQMWEEVVKIDPDNQEGLKFLHSSQSKIVIDDYRTQIENIANSISDKPHLDDHGLACFADALIDCDCLIEYGAGGSSVFATKKGVPRIISVESDRQYIKAVEMVIDKLNSNVRFDGLFVDIGPTKQWGFPVDISKISQWNNYCVRPWAFIDYDWNGHLVVLIDGRFRVACFLLSLIYSKDGTVLLFDDYANRINYHVVEKFIKPISLCGRMAKFVVSEPMDVNRIVPDILKYSVVPD